MTDVADHLAALYHEVQEVAPEVRADITNEMDLRQTLVGVELAVWEEAYWGQCDYDAKAHFLERVYDLDPGLCLELVESVTDREIEEFPYYLDYDYEISYLMALAERHPDAFRSIGEANVLKAEDPWYAFSVVAQTANELDTELLRILIRRGAEMQSQSVLDEIPEWIGEYYTGREVLEALEEVDASLSGQQRMPNTVGWLASLRQRLESPTGA